MELNTFIKTSTNSQFVLRQARGYACHPEASAEY